MQKYLKDCDLEYVGQRPWRQDDLSKESYTTKEDPNAIKTLRIFEQKYNLSVILHTHAINFNMRYVNVERYLVVSLFSFEFS